MASSHLLLHRHTSSCVQYSTVEWQALLFTFWSADTLALRQSLTSTMSVAVVYILQDLISGLIQLRQETSGLWAKTSVSAERIGGGVKPGVSFDSPDVFLTVLGVPGLVVPSPNRIAFCRPQQSVSFQQATDSQLPELGKSQRPGLMRFSRPVLSLFDIPVWLESRFTVR